MRHFTPLLLILILATPAFAQPPGPPPAAKYKVTLRYHIPAPRDQHVVQYDAMIRFLQRVNFEFDPPLEKHADTDREDRSKNYVTGTIAPANVLKLLELPAVQSILLIPFAPEEYKLPEGPEDPVTVRLELANNLAADRQRELASQTVLLLRELGFKEAVGYDHRGYTKRGRTRIVGTIPRSKLDLLQRDLRTQPAGWLGPIISRDELPEPLRTVNPIQVVEVIADGAAIKPYLDRDLRDPEYLEKISPELWEFVKEKEISSAPVRVQIGFAGTLDPDELAWKQSLKDLAPGFFLDGQLGAFVTGVVRLDQVKGLASSPTVTFLRFPRPPTVDVEPGIKTKGDNARALEQSGLSAFHARGYQGKGVCVGIIDRDFRGWETLVKAKQLPARTRLVDLTAEEDFDVQPKSYGGAPGRLGHGTLCAQAAALAAPEAELVLIRVDVIDPYQLRDVLRMVQDGRVSTITEQLHGELTARAGKLAQRRAVLLRERTQVLNDFTDETDLRETFEFLGPVFAWLYSEREWHRQRMAYHQKLEEEQSQREDRYRRLLKDIASLKDIQILVNPYTWDSGYPLGGSSPLSKAIARGDGAGPLWFQSVGNTRGQSWLAPFRNAPGEPAMKFADDADKLPAGRWSNEVNFLAWQPHLGALKPDLPAGARLRLTVQWREPHDPDYYLRPGEDDFYHRPLASLRMNLLRQRDPQSKALPADFFELVTRTAGLPQRLEHLPGGSIYELMLDVPLANAGRYAVQIERQVNQQWIMGTHPHRKAPAFGLLDGLTPTGVRPLGVTTLPALEKNWELRPRVFVEVIDPANRSQGRALFADFATTAGAIGVPVDARGVISVGAASLKNQPQPYSAFGSPARMEMARRPSIYAYDELELAGGGAYGTPIANAFAAGTAAAMMSGSVTREQVVQMLRAQEGRVLRAPVGAR